MTERMIENRVKKLQTIEAQQQKPALDNCGSYVLLVDPDSLPPSTADLHHQLHIAVYQVCVVWVVTNQIIVVYRLDRISRNIGDFAKLIETLNGMKIDFISIIVF